MIRWLRAKPTGERTLHGTNSQSSANEAAVSANACDASQLQGAAGHANELLAACGALESGRG